MRSMRGSTWRSARARYKPLLAPKCRYRIGLLIPASAAIASMDASGPSRWITRSAASRMARRRLGSRPRPVLRTVGVRCTEESSLSVDTLLSRLLSRSTRDHRSVSGHMCDPRRAAPGQRTSGSVVQCAASEYLAPVDGVQVCGDDGGAAGAESGVLTCVHPRQDDGAAVDVA